MPFLPNERKIGKVYAYKGLWLFSLLLLLTVLLSNFHKVITTILAGTIAFFLVYVFRKKPKK